MTRLLLIGCGKIAEAFHLPALQLLRDEGVVDVTVSDLDPARAAAMGRQFGFATATVWDEAVPDHDAVSICAPPGSNAQLAVAALDLGVHVLCEKPPGRDHDQAVAMASAASRQPGAVSMVGFNRRSMPLYVQAMRLSRELGPPTSFAGRFTRDAMGASPSNTASDWITSDGSHAIDLAIATTAMPTHVTVSRRQVGGGLENVWSIQLHSEGATASLMLHFAAGRRLERYEWAGPGYDVVFDAPGRIEWARAGQPMATLTGKDVGAGNDAATTWGFVDQYRRFLAAIADPSDRPEWDFAHGARFMNVVGTILSAPSDITVPVDEATAAPTDVAHEPTEDGAIATPSSSGLERRLPPPSVTPVVLLHQPPSGPGRFLGEEGRLTLERRCDVRSVTSLEGLPDGLGDAHILVTGRGAPLLPKGYLDAAPSLGLVVVLGASVGGVHPKEALARGITICNTADAVAALVAEHCLMLTLAGLRHLVATDRAMRAGGWPRPAGRQAPAPPRQRRPAGDPTSRRIRLVQGLPGPLRRAVKKAGRAVRPQLDRVEDALARRRGRGDRSPDLPPPEIGAELSGQTVGLIGWGHTARHFARLLAPFDCELLVCSENADQAELDAAGARRVSLGEVLNGSKVVSLHRGLTPASKGFLGRSQLAQLRPGTVLVNVARAGLVDEDALLERVAVGDIAVALDVFWEEPLPGSHPVRQAANVILTPHHASSTASEERRMGAQAIETITDWLDGRPVTEITLQRLSAMT